MLCRCEDLSDVCTILLSAHVSCYVGVKIFLMYAQYYSQPCLMLCRCEDLSDVCNFDPCLMLCRCEDLSDVCTTFVSPVSCYVV